MIEKIVLDYLKENIIVPCFMEVPEQPPSIMVIIEKTGSGVNNHVYEATIAIQSYSTSLYKAAELNELVKECMENIITIDKICSCELNSDYNYTDTEMKKYRYQAVFDIAYLK